MQVVASMFDGATLTGTLGTPRRPGVVAIRVDGLLLASAGTFAEVVDLAGRRASGLTAK